MCQNDENCSQKILKQHVEFLAKENIALKKNIEFMEGSRCDLSYFKQAAIETERKLDEMHEMIKDLNKVSYYGELSKIHRLLGFIFVFSLSNWIMQAIFNVIKPIFGWT